MDHTECAGLIALHSNYLELAPIMMVPDHVELPGAYNMPVTSHFLPGSAGASLAEWLLSDNNGIHYAVRFQHKSTHVKSNVAITAAECVGGLGKPICCAIRCRAKSCSN